MLKEYKRYLVLTFFVISASVLSAQNTHKGQLRLSYIPIERIQMGGASVNLPTHFHFLKPFDTSSRFAPDEPSSFSSLEYSFWTKEISEKISLESAFGVFRNHIKGDFLLDGQEPIHFGRGNSQVGPSLSLAVHYIWSHWSLGTYLQSGIGPHFSKWTSAQKTYDPEGWGIKGFGWTSNLSAFIESPKWKSRFSVRAIASYNVSYSSYGNFSSTNDKGIQTHYIDLSFSARSKRPFCSIGLAYDLGKNN